MKKVLLFLLLTVPTALVQASEELPLWKVGTPEESAQYLASKLSKGEYEGVLDFFKQLSNKNSHAVAIINNIARNEKLLTPILDQFLNRINAINIKDLIGLAEFLLQQGADAQGSDKNGRPFITTIFLPELAQLLIKYGAKINTQDEHGNTLLHNYIARLFSPYIPVNEDFVKTVIAFLDLGADASIKNKRGSDAYSQLLIPKSYGIKNYKLLDALLAKHGISMPFEEQTPGDWQGLEFEEAGQEQQSAQPTTTKHPQVLETVLGLIPRIPENKYGPQGELLQAGRRNPYEEKNEWVEGLLHAFFSYILNFGDSTVANTSFIALKRTYTSTLAALLKELNLSPKEIAAVGEKYKAAGQENDWLNSQEGKTLTHYYTELYYQAKNANLLSEQALKDLDPQNIIERALLIELFPPQLTKGTHDNWLVTTDSDIKTESFAVNYAPGRRFNVDLYPYSKFFATKEGAAWFTQNKDEWFTTSNGLLWLLGEDQGVKWLNSKQGQAWLASKKGQDLLGSFKSQVTITTPKFEVTTKQEWLGDRWKPLDGVHRRLDLENGVSFCPLPQPLSVFDIAKEAEIEVNQVLSPY